jgi:ribose/xylose/arabinose/galactoside ABC-type transport system permease subunit
MNKKDLFLLILILAVGAVVAILNPRFLLPVNIANTSNLVGLFGLSAIGQAFVIITGGIELSVGSVIALVGVLFMDLIANEGVPWPLALVLMIVLGVLIGLAHEAQAAAVHRHTVRIAGLSRHRALLHAGCDGWIWFRAELPGVELADRG